MNRSRAYAVLGWGGLGAMVVGVVLTATASDVRRNEAPPAGTIQLTKQNQRIVVPADETYGIWADDSNNTGWSMSRECAIVDDRGRTIQLDLFEETAGEIEVGSSPYAEFVYTFNTGSGELAVRNCMGSGAEFSVRPVGETERVE